MPSPLQSRKRIEALNTLVEDVEASSDCWEKADELSISVNDGQFSDISSVAGDDIDIISRKVEEYTVSTESRQVIEEMEVAVGSTSLNYHTVTSAKEKSSTCYEASSIRTEKLNAIKKSQDRRFILGDNVWNVCRYHGFRPKLTPRFDAKWITGKTLQSWRKKFLFHKHGSKHFHITLNYLCSRGWGHRGRDCIW